MYSFKNIDLNFDHKVNLPIMRKYLTTKFLFRPQEYTQIYISILCD